MEAIKYNLPSRLNESVLDVIVENSIVSIVDSFGRIEYVNESFCNLLESNASELLGETLELLKSPRHIELVYKNLWKSIKSRQKWNGILNTKTSNGKSITLDTIIVPIKTDNYWSYVIKFKDITLHYNENVKLLQQENKSKTFLENMPLHIFSITKYGKILDANKRICDIEIVDIIGTYVYDHINPSCYEVLKNNIDIVFKDKISKQFEFYDFDENERKTYYSSIISPVFNDLGVVVTATICFHEITDYKGLSEDIQHKEAKYRSIYKSLNVGINVVADDKGKIREWNKGAKLAFGYSETEILGRPITVLTSKKYREPNIKELIIAIRKIKENQDADIIEIQCLRKNGEEFPVEFTLNRLRVNGETMYCALMIDITKRKSLEIKLNQKRKDLEQFLYRSAHDLRAPFSSAQGLVNLLKEENNKEQAQVIIEMLSTTINTGKDLSNNLSEASMISAKNYEDTYINFHKTTNDVIENLSDHENFKFIDFKIDIDVQQPFKSKPELINSIFQNLIENAVKYSKEPSENHTPIIDIAVKYRNEELMIVISDNGTGIKKQCIKNIFDLYYKSCDKDVSGSGLGLYIVKSIVESFDGNIKVNSDFNNGACFKIHLPQLK